MDEGAPDAGQSSVLVVHIDVQCTGRIEFGPWSLSNEIYELGMRVCYMRSGLCNLFSIEESRSFARSGRFLTDAHYFFPVSNEMAPEVRLRNYNLSKSDIMQHVDLVVGAFAVQKLDEFVDNLLCGNPVQKVYFISQYASLVREILLVQWRQVFGDAAVNRFARFGWLDVHRYMACYFSDVGRLHVDGPFVYRCIQSTYLAAIQMGSAAGVSSAEKTVDGTIDKQASVQNLDAFVSLMAIYGAAGGEFDIGAVDNPCVVCTLDASTRLASVFGMTAVQVKSAISLIRVEFLQSADPLFRQYIPSLRVCRLCHLLLYAKAFLVRNKQAEWDNTKVEWKYVFRAMQYILRSAGVCNDAVIVQVMAGAVGKADCQAAIYEYYFCLFKSGSIQLLPLQIEEEPANELRHGADVHTLNQLYTRYCVSGLAGAEKSTTDVVQVREQNLDYLLGVVMKLESRNASHQKKKLFREAFPMIMYDRAVFELFLTFR